MSWSLNIGKVAGTVVRIPLTFLLSLAWIFAASYSQGGAATAWDSVLFMVLLFLCVLLHEFGHIFTARAFGVPTPYVTLLPIGGVAQLERIPEEPGQEFLIAIAGPLVNVVITILLVAVGGATLQTNAAAGLDNTQFSLIDRLAAVNLFLALFNMTPAFPMDGGRVGVFGLGVEGRAALARLEALGCDVVIVDDDPGATGDERALGTGAGGLVALAACDAVVKSPGISRYRDDVASLQRRGVPVLGGVGRGLEEADRHRVVCVTGTKGKSTVSTVIGHLATRLGTPTAVTGNLGAPPFAPGVDLEGKLVVVETSSFQATDVAHSPSVVAVTSLGDDHLDWHGSAERYHADKLSLTRQPGARHTIAAATPPLLERREQLGGEVTWVRDGGRGRAG